MKLKICKVIGLAACALICGSVLSQITETNLQVIWQLTTSNVIHTNDHARNPFFLSSLPYKSSLKCIAIEGVYSNGYPYTWLVTSNGGQTWFDAGLAPFSTDFTSVFNRANITLPFPIRLYTNGSNDWGVKLTNTMALSP